MPPVPPQQLLDDPEARAILEFLHAQGAPAGSPLCAHIQGALAAYCKTKGTGATEAPSPQQSAAGAAPPNGPYQLMRAIGSGASSTVYEARLTRSVPPLAGCDVPQYMATTSEVSTRPRSSAHARSTSARARCNARSLASRKP